MAVNPRKASGPGPFRVDQIRPGDPYELSDGHPVFCAPTGRDGSRGNLVGAEVLDTDPDVESAGIDTGFALRDRTLRAPDIAVGSIADRPGWEKDRPPALAVEYAGVGQDEEMLREKIDDLLAAGTRYLWVVRLDLPRRVEVYEPGRAMEVRAAGAQLTAPGVLRNPVPVEALFDRQVAHRMTLRNLLQREGYESVEAVREEGREEGRDEGREEGLERLRSSLRRILEARGLGLTPEQSERIDACRDLAQVEAWIGRAITAASPATLLID